MIALSRRPQPSLMVLLRGAALAVPAYMSQSTPVTLGSRQVGLNQCTVDSVGCLFDTGVCEQTMPSLHIVLHTRGVPPTLVAE